MLEEIDSEEIAEWYAYDQRWPLSDGWQQTARICRIIMAASGNYKRNDVPDESAFIPAARKAGQSQAAMMAELAKLQQWRNG